MPLLAPVMAMTLLPTFNILTFLILLGDIFVETAGCGWELSFVFALLRNEPPELPAISDLSYS